jgi:hypothetical protein
MASVAAVPQAGRGETSLRWGTWLMGLAAVGFIGYAVIFFVLNFTRLLEIGIGPEQVGVTRSQIEEFSPAFYEYVSHLQVALSGGIAAIGLAVLFLLYGVRQGFMWAWIGAVATPVLFLAVALPMHYPNGFDTIGHLGLIYLATGIFVVGALVALRGLRAGESR